MMQKQVVYEGDLNYNKMKVELYIGEQKYRGAQIDTEMQFYT